MYRYDDLDQHAGRRTGGRVPRPGSSATSPASSAKTSSGRCACATAFISSAMRRCCASRSRTACCPPRSCGRWRTSRAIRPRLWPLHHAPEHPVQLAAGSRRRPTSWPTLAEVEMHAIQTSGNCVRNITTRRVRRRRAATRSVDPRAVRRDPAPVVDVPSRVHLAAAQVQDRDQRRREDRAAIRRSTTSACSVLRDADGDVGLRVLVGGGMGRTPMIGT